MPYPPQLKILFLITNCYRKWPIKSFLEILKFSWSKPSEWLFSLDSYIISVGSIIISKLHSILAKSNLLAHNNKSQICYCCKISLQNELTQFSSKLEGKNSIPFVYKNMNSKPSDFEVFWFTALIHITWLIVILNLNLILL